MNNDKTIYYHNLNNQNPVLLAVGVANCTIALTGLDGETIIEFGKDGYYRFGNEFAYNIKFYKDSDNKIYIVRNRENTYGKYVTIKNISQTGGGSGFIANFQDNFSTSGLTQLYCLNAPTTKHVSSKGNRDAGTYNYESIANNSANYTAMGSFVIVSARNANGTGGTKIFMLSKKNEATNLTYTITDIVSTLPSQFIISGTQAGFSITDSSARWRYDITEIASMIPDNKA